MDTLTREQRSERMSRVRGADTKTEMVVRRAIVIGFIVVACPVSQISCFQVDAR